MQKMQIEDPTTFHVSEPFFTTGIYPSAGGASFMFTSHTTKAPIQ